jgi:hypothetical protein
MKRVLLRFDGPRHRRAAAHCAALFARRGVDVDLVASRPTAAMRAGYDLVLDAADVGAEDILALTPSGAEGAIRIVGAEAPAEPIAAPSPRTRWMIPAGVLIALAAAFSLAAQGAPLLYAALLGVLTGAGATCVFQSLRAPAHPMQSDPACPIPSHGAGSSVSAPFSFR